MDAGVAFMSHVWGEPEEITVSLDSAGRPLAFSWHGRRHPVEKWGDPYLVGVVHRLLCA